MLRTIISKSVSVTARCRTGAIRGTATLPAPNENPEILYTGVSIEMFYEIAHR